ncbi:MAG: YbjQ family protein [Bacteroidales bacterium]|nr:YbjQ family protein [Bacteroidales bacterium]
MELYTVEFLSGKDYIMLGTVSGSIVKAKNVVSDFGQSIKNIVGGELKAYTRMMESAREEATQRMIEQAHKMGADAVIGIRYTTSSIMAQAAEVLVYGTAIHYKN